MIQFSLNSDSFHPGDTLQGRVSWHLDKAAKSGELNLLWYTSGKGSEDIVIFESKTLPNLSAQGEFQFNFTLPLEPYSFSGTLISLQWIIELVFTSPDESAQQEITLSPSGKEIMLPKETVQKRQ